MISKTHRYHPFSNLSRVFWQNWIRIHFWSFVNRCDTHRVQTFRSLRWSWRMEYIAVELIFKEHSICWYVICGSSSINNRIASVAFYSDCSSRSFWLMGIKDMQFFALVPGEPIENRSVRRRLVPKFQLKGHISLSLSLSLSLIQVIFSVAPNHHTKLLSRQFKRHCENDQ